MAIQEGTIQERVIEYPIGDAIYQGLLVWDEGISGPRPGVLVAHAWGGRSPFEDDKARWLASLGYAGFALDMYGKGIRGATVEENTALMTPLVDNRAELQVRIGAALSTLREQDEVDARRCAAMGFCFGGLCVLDLARIGTPLAGVVSVHGLFNPPGNTRDTAIQARVLCPSWPRNSARRGPTGSCTPTAARGMRSPIRRPTTRRWARFTARRPIAALTSLCRTSLQSCSTAEFFRAWLLI